MKGTVSDLVNSPSEPYGGCCCAAAYLKNFVAVDTAWAHLDIAGPAHVSAPHSNYVPKGCTGFGVETLVNFLQQLARKKE